MKRRSQSKFCCTESYVFFSMLAVKWAMHLSCMTLSHFYINRIYIFIKFSTSVNAVLVLWLVHSVSVIISDTLVWPYMAIDCAKRCKLKLFSPESEISLWLKQKKYLFVETLDQFRLLKVRERQEMFLWWDHKVLHNIASSSSFFDFARIARFFRSYFVLPNFWSLRNLIKQLLHSRLLDMRLVIANSTLRPSLAIYHLISNARSWNNC